MARPTLFILTFEGLSPAALGGYGCSWNETPTLDQLASQGCVWDRFVVESDQPNRVLSTWIDRGAAWARKNGQLDGSAVLITDSNPNELTDTCFDEILSVPFEDDLAERQPASDVTETHFARLIAAAVEQAGRPDPHRVIWIHSRFLTETWDAPIELLSPADFDFEVPNETAQEGTAVSTKPPSIELADEDDPDLISNWMRAYACQVRLIDLLLGLLLDSIPSEDPTVVIAGTSAYRLGQGGWIGHQVGPLRSVDVRVPLIVGRGGPLHIPHLTPGREFNAILATAIEGVAAVCPPEKWSVAAAEAEPTAIESNRAIAATCCSGWFYVQDPDRSEHLYLKPDDLEDFNDVGRLREDVLESLRTGLPLK